MISNIKELAVSYPFLPLTTVPGALKHIKDVRIIYILPVGDGAATSSHSLEHYAELIAITEAVASFRIVCTILNIDEQVDVPVTTGVDVVPVANSYIIVDEPVAYTGTHRLHPDCVLFMQQAPRLSVRERTDVTKNDEATYEEPILIAGPTIAINDGHNVQASGTTAGMRFTGGVGSGKGIYTELPYNDVEPDDVKMGHGLKSINGITDAVTIAGSSSVSLQSFGAISVHISPNPVPEI